jgi:hypothetical protein
MKSNPYNSAHHIQSNSDKSEAHTFQNLFQMFKEEKSSINIKKKKSQLTHLKINSNYKDPEQLNCLKKAQSCKELLEATYKYNLYKKCLLKEANGKRFLETEVEPINSHSNISKNGRKRRSNSVGSIAFNMFILIQNILPIVGKVINLPKNSSLKEIINRIDARIDDRTFLKLKYNKRLGLLYIKFRNEIYYNYYSCLFNGRSYFRNGEYLKITEIQENENLWTQNQDEELLNFYFNNNKPEGFIYKFYIKKNFRFRTKSRFVNYFYNY